MRYNYNAAVNEQMSLEDAVKEARIVPVKHFNAESIMMYDIFIGKKWHGSRGRLLDAQRFLLTLLRSKF